ncbi:glutathione S-transferase [Lasiosphaeria miniovina]|uniref:Glutathione S-transferase n=1 Tax=Lasiosphaeria miniovina TaxID=1954250 RepID=A0AA40BGE4_9PEZI|nr:glutathione S-transferase [Lasiosphaeria miniovina]KAK0733771.1 glutathione S-transferase [Lasiosphaeria miniovina]
MATVDTTLPGNTSGAAAALAAAHSAEHPLKLYGGWFCPFVQRAWIVLAEKRIPHQYVEINPYHKAPEFLALNPRGLVPTLEVPPADADANNNKNKQPKPLYESTVVCDYLDEAFADPGPHGPRLLPENDVYERARCRLWIDHICSRVVPAFYRLLQHTGDKPYSLDEGRRGLHGHLRAFADEMLEHGDEDGGGPWFLGARFGLVDVMLAPWAKRLWLIDYYKTGGTGIPSAAGTPGDDATWARWRRWFDAAVSRQSVVDTWSSEDQYVEAYRRYADDTTQSEVGQATRQGKSRLP